MIIYDYIKPYITQYTTNQFIHKLFIKLFNNILISFLWWCNSLLLFFGLLCTVLTEPQVDF